MVAPGSGRRCLVALLLVLAVVAAACGDDDDDDTAAEAPGTTRDGAQECDSPGVTDAEIKVGLINPTSGNVQTQFVPIEAGVRARFEKENEENGGVNGRKLTLTAKDTGNDRTRNAQEAKALVEQEGVFGIIETDPADEGSAPYLAENNVPVTGFALGVHWGESRNFFGFAGSTFPDTDFHPSTGGVQRFMIDQGATKLATFGFAGNPESSSAAENFGKAFEENGGETVLVSQVPFGSASFTADVQRIKESGADALSGSITADSFVPLYLAAKQAGLEFKAVVTPTGYDQRLIDAVGSQMAGVYFTNSFAPFELGLPAHGVFDAAMAKYQPQQQPARQQFSMIGWISADLFVRGVQEAGDCPTREGFVEGLNGVGDYDADGLLPPRDIGASFGQAPACNYIVQIAPDGKQFVPVNDGEPLCVTYKET